jgi:hypothetical protein
MKKVVVTSINWKETIEVDETIFDDYKLEACTQAMERAINNGSLTVTALLQCWVEPKSKKNVSVYNTYKILINAGFHSKAEILRSVFLSKTKVDLADEPIKG